MKSFVSEKKMKEMRLTILKEIIRNFGDDEYDLYLERIDGPAFATLWMTENKLVYARLLDRFSPRQEFDMAMGFKLN